MIWGAISLVFSYGWDAIIVGAGAFLLAVGLFGRLGAVVIPPLAVVPAAAFVVARWAGVALMVYGGGSAWLVRHDTAVEARWVEAQRAAVQAQQDKDRVAGDAVVAAMAADLRDRAAQAAKIEMVIDHVPTQTACVDSPLLRAYRDSLRASP